MQDFVNAINDWVWSPALIYLCLLVGLYFSIRGLKNETKKSNNKARYNK